MAEKKFLTCDGNQAAALNKTRKKTTENNVYLYYLERLPLKRMLATIFQKYFQSMRKGCSK